MNYANLRKIDKLYFGYPDIGTVLGITPASARVSANRYVRQGYLVRVKRNLYVLRERWDRLSGKELFIIANLIQVPSYVSLMTAMGYHDVTTQIQRDFIESIAIKRTKSVDVRGRAFTFSKIDSNLYFGFERRDELEIGPLYKGQGAEARESYIDGISKVLLNCQKYLAGNFDVFLVANDKYNLYPSIAERSGMSIVNQFKRPVLNRTERDKAPYSEIIFHLKNRK